MNKRLLFIGGGTFTVLLAIFAVLSSNNDDSLITRKSSQSFLTFEQVTQLSASESLIDNNSDPSKMEAVNPKQVMNLTRLSNTIQYMIGQALDVNATRTSAIITTDKVVYRGNDTIFVEVLLIDALTNRPVQLPAQATNVNDTFIRVDIGLFNSAGYPLNQSRPFISQNVTNLTGPAVSVVFRLPQDISYGDYAIRVAGVKFSPASKIVQVRMTGQDPQPYQQQQPPSYNIQSQVFGDSFNINETVHGKVTIQSLTGEPLPSTVSVIIDSGAETDGDQFIYSVSEGQAYFYFTPTPTFLGNSSQIRIICSAYDSDYTSYTADIIVLNFNRPDIQSNQTRPQNQQQQQVFNPNGIDPNFIKTYFQTEALSDLVVNVSQKVYFYTYVNPNGEEPTDNVFNFGQGQIRAYNQLQANMTTNPINVTAVNQIYSGFGVFNFYPREFLTYFLEIRVPNLVMDVERNLDIRRDNVSMKGNHILDNGVVRIPLVVEGFQTRRNRFDSMIDIQNNPNSFKPTFNEDLLIDYNFTVVDQTSGFVYQYDGNLWTIGSYNMPPLLVFSSFPNPNNFNNTLGFFYNYTQGFIPNPQNGLLPQTLTMNTISFNAATVVSKFVAFARQALFDLDQGNATLLNFTMNNTLDAAILSRLFPGNSLPTQNSFGNYGPSWLKQNANLTQAPPAAKNITRVQAGPEVVVALLNQNRQPTRTVANNEDINLNITTNNFVDPNDYYLILIKQKDRILYSEAIKLSKASSNVKTIKATSFNMPMGGIMNANIYKITEDYFLFQNTTNGTLCDYNLLEQLMLNGTLQVQKNGSVIYQGKTINATNASLQALNPLNSSIPYTPLPINCVLITLEQAANFLEQKGSISFFKRPSANLTVEIVTNKQNYMQGEQVNVTVNVRNANNKNLITDPGYLYVSTTEDKDLNETLMPDLPAQLYLFQDIDERRFEKLNPGKTIGQYFMTQGANSSDLALEVILAASQLRNLVFEFEYFLQMSRDLQFGRGGNLTITDVINLSQMYGFNFLGGQGPDSQLMMFNMMEVLQALPPSEGINWPYRRTFAPTSIMMNQTQPLTGLNWTHLTPPNYNRSANIDWTETLFWGSGIKTVGGRANVTFATSDLNTAYRIQANFYSNVGVATSYKRFTVGKAFNYRFKMPSQMAVNDTYNATLTIENFSPSNITIQVIPLQLDNSSLLVTTDNGSDLSLFKFQSLANRTQTFNVNVTPLKAIKKASLTLAVRGNASDLLSNYSEVFTNSYRVFNSGLTRKFLQAGAISTNSSDNSSSVNFTVSFPENVTINTTQGTIYLTTQLFSTLTTFVNLFEQVEPVTSDDIIGRIDILQMLLDQMQPMLAQMGPNLPPSITGFIKEINWKQTQYLKKLMTYAINSGSFQSPSYQGFDNFRGDNTTDTRKTGSIVNTAYAAFILNTNPQLLRNLKGANETYQAAVKYLLQKRSSNAILTQKDTDSDYTYRIGQVTLNAFYTLCLNQLRVNASTNVTVNNTQEIRALITAINSTTNFSINAWQNITSDPYQLALTIVAVATANQSFITPQIQNFTQNVTIPQLLKHFDNMTGAVQPAPQTVNITQSPFNSQGNDRVVEQTSWSIMALAMVNATRYAPAIRLAANFLRRQHPMAIIQNGYTLDIMLRALQMSEMISNQELLGQQESATVQVSYNGSVLQSNQFSGGSGAIYKLNISNPVFKANTTGNFTFKVTQASNDTKQIFYFADLSYVDNKFNGVPPRPNDVNVSISTNYTQKDVRDKNFTNLYGYAVTVLNQDQLRASSPVYVTLRIPACLDTDQKLLSDSFRSQKVVVADFISNDDEHLFTVLVKPIEAKKSTVFNVAVRQVDQGSCKMRYVTAKNKGSGEEYALKFNGI
ncbi:large extracellular alpha-helical protein [Stylonychia lemnae]|uniref:Large extracellular alpha-helical protein n=1 Tax=Stylonychia lemnae TaxID=5949 RepID=A0A078A2Z3_STYLE|nr:large extracellular alpha-helical protein [Stylonychia lemnae]|eukprot:CDW75858.1 large extracellular alpha-helical protein [Stylonychia lemnae]